MTSYHKFTLSFFTNFANGIHAVIFSDINFISFPKSLNACGHQFCNSCWRTHLKTLIGHGNTELQCPGYECSTTIDHVTLMSLVPSLYGRHVAKRLDTFLEMDPEWKWCPADQCKLVVKATSSQNISGRHLTSLDAVQPVPVVCVCGTMWCFKCQEDAHWPATCDEARIFRQRNEGYAKMIINSQSTSLITSVNVKNCPFCHYPIEKGPGCNHMVCGLCSKEFCWWCLQKWSWDHVCQAKHQVTKREVDLPVDTKHLQSYEYLAVTSRIARSGALINKVNKKLDRLEQSVKIYGTLSPKVKESKLWGGCARRQMDHFTENNRIQDLREVISFKFQALLALEGLAIVLSFTRDSPNKRLVWEFHRLFFIVERLSETLQDLNTCVHQGTLDKLKHFVACGKECLFVIDRKRK